VFRIIKDHWKEIRGAYFIVMAFVISWFSTSVLVFIISVFLLIMGIQDLIK
jgi:hypothetical protein